MKFIGDFLFFSAFILHCLLDAMYCLFSLTMKYNLLDSVIQTAECVILFLFHSFKWCNPFSWGVLHVYYAASYCIVLNSVICLESQQGDKLTK